MFGMLTDAIESMLDVGTGMIEGEMPSKSQVAKLIDDGFSIATVATLFGVGTEVIESLLGE